MLKFIIPILLAASALFGETIRLYLKDGTYQLATDYKVVKDRVSYMSAERGEWEDLPLEMVDLDRTKKEVAQHQSDVKADAKAQAEEEVALKNAVKEVEEIPEAPGVYYIHNDKLETVKVGESKIVNDKRRQMWKVLSPIPMVAGKATLEISGDSSSTAIDTPRPEFFFRLSEIERFGIVKLTPTKKDSRIVETINIIPVTKEIDQQMKEIAAFKKMVGDNVYRVWPENDMEPGEYALVEYTEGLDHINTQVWDFKIVSK